MLADSAWRMSTVHRRVGGLLTVNVGNLGVLLLRGWLGPLCALSKLVPHPNTVGRLSAVPPNSICRLLSVAPRTR